jgi:pimeloyl-ACP methyl ester carboxylesterase
LIIDVAVPGGQVQAAVDGGGAPVVLVHSGITDRAMWSEVVQHLGAGRTVVRPDLRGYGASPPPTGPFRHADDVRTVLDRLDLDRVVLVGASFGGLVALEVATAWPDRVSALGLLAPPLPGHVWSPALRKYFDAEEAALEADDLDGAVELNLDTWIRGPVREWSPATRAIAEAIRPALRVALDNQAAVDEYGQPAEVAVRDALSDLTMPTVVVVGGADQPDFPAIAEHLARTVRNARLERWPDVGHLIAMERPTETADLIASLA